MTVADRKTFDMRPGDIVRVHQKIKEGDKTRVQIFEGLVIARKHGTEPGATFTVRKTSLGVGVERIYPLYSPNIEKIEIIKRSPKIRRAKLYYIREKAAREQRRKMRHELLADRITAGGVTEPETEEQSQGGAQVESAEQEKGKKEKGASPADTVEKVTAEKEEAKVEQKEEAKA